MQSDAPERGVPRLFVGNLSSSVTEDALRRTLSEYGTVRSVDRRPRFAHVSIVPQSDGSIDTCISRLNRTKWGGFELRVERADEHYLWRLEREREEMKQVALPEVPDQEDKDHDPDSAASLSLKASAVWKGARITFPDEPSSESDTEMAIDERVMSPKIAEQLDLSERGANAEPVMSAIEESANVERERSLPSSRYVSAISDSRELTSNENRCPSSPRIPSASLSTLELFGLTQSEADPTAMEDRETPASSTRAEQTPESHIAEKSTERLVPRDKDSTRSTKRMRRTSSVVGTCDPASEATAIDDVADERRRNHDILVGMFPDLAGAATPNNASGFEAHDRVIESLRRSGLFRQVREQRLGAVGDLSSTPGEARSSGTRLPYKRTPCADASTPALASVHVAPLAAPVKRRGLFRTL